MKSEMEDREITDKGNELPSQMGRKSKENRKAKRKYQRVKK